MSRALLERMQRARERELDVGGHKFVIRRPTDADALGMQGKPPLDFVTRFVVGWNLTELDIAPGGNAEPAAFDPEVWASWVADRPDLWEPIATAVLTAYGEHVKQREEAAKNS